MLDAAHIGLFWGITAAAALLGFILTSAVIWAIVDLVRFIIEFTTGVTRERDGKSD